MISLSDAENRMCTIVSSFVWTKHRNVTDGRTDRQTDGQNRSGYYSGLHCDTAVKMVEWLAAQCWLWWNMTKFGVVS